MFELTKPEFIDNIARKLEQLPESPGVYLHKDASGKVIYVGKAVNLKNRVKSYFQSPTNFYPKLIAHVKNVADLDYILTDSETEALTLESNLIKAYRPYYNILLKDDKQFPYVRIDMHAQFPRAEIAYRIKKNDDAKYFGPYLSRTSVAESMDAVKKNFPLRICKKDISKAIARGERPCLNYHIGRCCGPCTGKVTHEEYMKYVDQVARFLSGKTEDVINELTAQMQEAAEKLNFERAAVLRDRIRSVQVISEKQKAIATKSDERDVFAYAELNGAIVVFALLMRGGKVVQAQPCGMTASSGGAPEDVMKYFLLQYYGEGAYIPKEILVNVLPGGEMSQWLEHQRGAKTELHSPERGDKKKLVEMAQKNAEDYLKRSEETEKRKWEKTGGALIALTNAIGLEEPPHRIECFDISHIQGVDTVASMVVFIDGMPANKQYRRFKIKTAGNDDCASMTEVLSRRIDRLISEREEGKTDGFAQTPGLWLIDGGIGQLNAALAVLEDKNISLPAVGIAERLEELILPGTRAPVLLPAGSPSLHLVQRIRDEAHRYAIEYHRSLRRKNALMSTLEKIPGIGPSRRRALFEAFVSIDEIKKADIDALKAVKGMNITAAQAVRSYFNQTEGERSGE